jgi:hypothetical protein
MNRSVVFSYFLSIADIFPFFYAFGSFYSPLFTGNCNSKARGARAIKRLLFFLKQRFQIILLDTSCKNHQHGYRWWRVCRYFNSGIFNVFSTGKSMKTYTISKVNSRWQQFEVFKKYYKACKLLFKENIPLGRPLKFSHPNSKVAVRRMVRQPPG